MEKILNIIIFLLALANLELLVEAEKAAETTGLFKFTKVICESYDKSWLIFTHCHVRPLDRYTSELNINVTLLRPVYKATLSCVVLKKAFEYKPFPVGFTVDACNFFDKRNHPFANFIGKMLKKYSSINHTCPYVGDQYTKGVVLRRELFNHLPWPVGEFALELNWTFSNAPIVTIRAYFINE